MNRLNLPSQPFAENSVDGVQLAEMDLESFTKDLGLKPLQAKKLMRHLHETPDALETGAAAVGQAMPPKPLFANGVVAAAPATSLAADAVEPRAVLSTPPAVSPLPTPGMPARTPRTPSIPSALPATTLSSTLAPAAARPPMAPIGPSKEALRSTVNRRVMERTISTSKVRRQSMIGRWPRQRH